MNSKEKEAIVRIKKSFSKIKKDNKLSTQEVDDFTTDVTELLGIYLIDKNKETEKLIEKMLSFARKNNLAAQGSRLEFESIKKRIKS